MSTNIILADTIDSLSLIEIENLPFAKLQLYYSIMLYPITSIEYNYFISLTFFKENLKVIADILHNKTIEKNKELINSNLYKVFVFDLDDTLYMRNFKGDVTTYNLNLINFLEKLYNRNDTILCIATHNYRPNILLTKLNIQHLFTHIISENKMHFESDSIQNYTCKIKMMNEIIEKTKCKKDDIIFFDDSTFNINKINSMGIKTVLVSVDTGILFENIII